MTRRAAGPVTREQGANNGVFTLKLERRRCISCLLQQEHWPCDGTNCCMCETLRHCSLSPAGRASLSVENYSYNDYYYRSRILFKCFGF